MPVRRRVIVAVTFVAFTTLVCAGLFTAAVLVPAPTVVLPVVIAACLGSPMAAVYELATALQALRDPHGRAAPRARPAA